MGMVQGQVGFLKNKALRPVGLRKFPRIPRTKITLARDTTTADKGRFQRDEKTFSSQTCIHGVTIEVADTVC
jgi:hypothetical protein